MNFMNLFTAIKKDFPENIAIGVCTACAIHLSIKIKEKDLNEPGRYQRKIEKKIKAVLWEYDTADVETIIKLESLVYDWQISNSCAGLGGCTPKSFLELYQKAIEIS